MGQNRRPVVWNQPFVETLRFREPIARLLTKKDASTLRVEGEGSLNDTMLPFMPQHFKRTLVLIWAEGVGDHPLEIDLLLAHNVEGYLEGSLLSAAEFLGATVGLR
jgi:hypothetical protein